MHWCDSRLNHVCGPLGQHPLPEPGRQDSDKRQREDTVKPKIAQFKLRFRHIQNRSSPEKAERDAKERYRRLRAVASAVHEQSLDAQPRRQQDVWQP